MTKGYLGDICYNGKLHKNHIIYTNAEGRVEKISPFQKECEGIILCDGYIFLIDKDISINTMIEEEIRACFKNCKTLSDFYNSEPYNKYRATYIEGAQFLEI
ncbi:MAG: hypothetical protein J6R61_06965 [Bacteroidales bacterium]|nr:hypothetical protein [Bacteroidales bacterium]